MFTHRINCLTSFSSQWLTLFSHMLFLFPEKSYHLHRGKMRMMMMMSCSQVFILDTTRRRRLRQSWKMHSLLNILFGTDDYWCWGFINEEVYLQWVGRRLFIILLSKCCGIRFRLWGVERNVQRRRYDLGHLSNACATCWWVKQYYTYGTFEIHEIRLFKA